MSLLEPHESVIAVWPQDDGSCVYLAGLDENDNWSLAPDRRMAKVLTASELQLFHEDVKDGLLAGFYLTRP